MEDYVRFGLWISLYMYCNYFSMASTLKWNLINLAHLILNFLQRQWKWIEFLASVSIANVLTLKYCRPSLFGDVAMAPPIEVFQLTRDFQVAFLFLLKIIATICPPTLVGTKIYLGALAIFIPWKCSRKCLTSKYSMLPSFAFSDKTDFSSTKGLSWTRVWPLSDQQPPSTVHGQYRTYEWDEM